MSNRRIATMDVMEVVRLLRMGESDRAIAACLGHTRRSIARYRAWVQEQGLLQKEGPSAAEVHRLLAQTMPLTPPPQQTSTVATYRQEILAYRARGMEVAAIRGRLEEAHGQPVSYMAVWRLLQRLDPTQPEVTVRVETPPGSQAQVDFGYAGYTIDPATGKPRKTWAFVLVLSWSRHCYAELVYDQRIATWLLCHRHAFECWGGCPRTIVLDNLKAAILHASVHEPVAQRSYRECAEHYGFRIDPNPPRTPRLKGKVEQGGVHYLKRNFLAGREGTERIDELNQKLRSWIMATAGERLHGTTREQPLTRFQDTERAALLALPAMPYDPASWARLRLYRDCHLTFEQAYYSAPFRLVGQELWVRGGARTIDIYGDDHQLIVTHDRAAPGERRTVLAHLPPEKIPGLVLTREACQQQADAIGPGTAAVVGELLEHRPEDRLRSAGRLVRLAGSVGPERLERACVRAQAYGGNDYPTVKRILAANLDEDPPPAAASAADGVGRPTGALTFTFARPADEYALGFLGASEPVGAADATGNATPVRLGILEAAPHSDRGAVGTLAVAR
ncbi:MAG: IS21 family transposase [Candidatus Dormibacteraceae bacterium]